MERSRRSQVLLAALVVVLGVVVYVQWPSTTSVGVSPSNSNRDSRAPGGPAATSPQVHLDTLQAQRPKPDETERNLFRFKPKPVPAPPRPAAPPAAAVSPAPGGPPSAPPLAPITLKFMGIVEAPDRGLKVAALSDQYGVYYGREGDTILGQYKILRIGAESIDVAYLDGRGRQTIRLSGS